ncbi:MAG: lysylphosphatidylglycerol synthase transmembrane domain-containing protein, partial [Chloroflexota bacterium]
LSSAGRALALRGVDLQQAAGRLGQAQLGWTVLGLLSMWLSIALRAWRWQALLGPAAGQIGRQRLAGAYLAGLLLNALLPLRAGEFGRVALAGRGGPAVTPPDAPPPGEPSPTGGEQHRKPSDDRQPGYLALAGSVVVEKLLDLAVFALLALWLTGGGSVSETLHAPARLLIAGGLAALAALAALVAWRKPALGFLERRLPARLQPLSPRLLRPGLHSLDALAAPGRAAAVAGLSLAAWGCGLANNYLAGRALGLPVSWEAAGLLLIVLQAGNSLPSLPANLGVFELAAVLALQAYGIDQTAALSYGILLRVIVYVPILLSGLPAFLLLSTRAAAPGSAAP